jgi:hypothetical protein
VVTLLLLLAAWQLPPAAQPVAPGITYRRIEKQAGGPFVFHVLEVDPRAPAINILPVHADDRAAGKETTSGMARRYGAAAAVNGGYFVVAGPYAGTSSGVYLWRGELLASGANRSALLFCGEKDRKEQHAIDVVNFRGSVTAGKATRAIEGLNRPRVASELVLYTAALGPSTLTAAGGAEAVLDAKDSVLQIVEANAAIPVGGRVLSASGDAAAWLRANLKPGMRARVDLRVEAPSLASCRPEHITGAGPRLIEQGQVKVTPEGFAHQNVRHPRTAFAVTREGKFLFVTLDGRQKASAGMTLPELAAELFSWGAVEAINLDGGGSSTLYANGRILNRVSDPVERPVSDAILIFSIATMDEWRAVFERLAAGHVRPNVAATIRQRLVKPARRDLEAAAKLIWREAGRGVTRQAAAVLAEPLEEFAAAAR